MTEKIETINAYFKGAAGKKPADERRTNDYYPTPPYATYALGTYVDLAGKRVLEPAAGRGWMARELSAMGATVTARDLFHQDDLLFPVETGVDFTEAGLLGEFDAVVTNPPYKKSMAEKFVRKSLSTGVRCTAILARLAFFESQGRFKLFTEHPPSLVLPFSRRFSCTESMFDSDPFGGMLPYAWFVWEEGNIDTRVRWIDSTSAHREWSRARNKEQNSA